jgi:ATP-binding cassette subfamily C protein LapB
MGARVDGGRMAKSSTKSWLKPIMKSVTPIYREVAVMSLFVNMIALATPIFVLQVYDRVVFYSGLGTLQGLVVGMAVVIMFDFVMRQSRTRLLQKAALRLDVHIGRDLFNKIANVPLIVLERRPSAYWRALFRDVDVVRNTLSGASALLLMDLPFALLFLAIIFIIATPVAWAIAIILPIFLILTARSGQVLSGKSETEREASYGRDALLGEMIAGRTTVKALALEQTLGPRWEERHADTIEHSIDRGGRADTYVNLGLVLAIATTVVVTTVGALAIIDQRMTIGSLIAANILASRIIGPFNQLVASWRNYGSYRQAVRRLGEVFLMDEEAERSDIELERPEGAIDLDEVTFRYALDREPAINGIKMQIKPPGLMAVVGPNGSGKTTLLKLMQGLYRPESGRVLVDGADIAQFSRRRIAHWIGYVPQDCFLFGGTIRDNIVMAKADVDDEEILRVSRLAGLHHHVIDLADGYDSKVDEGGQNLPGGIRQRIGIARALVGDPPILLMDEPSSNLDRNGEEELRASLLELAADHTVAIVTHSPLLLGACRVVVVLDRGRIVRGGPPQEVLPEIFGHPGTNPLVKRPA